ncbi:MAG: ABC-2 family transporter protein [Clostridia bacterium]|nr:ABC-2 family transporter protein [Clostridia bacterium]
MRYLYHAMCMNLKSIAQYRASFLMQNIAQFVMVGGEFLAVVVLMTRFTSAGQWSADEIMFFWGVMQFTFALCECLGRGISTFAYYVGSGDFDTMLLRPRPLMQQVMGHRLDPRRLGGMIVGGGAIALSCARLNIPWTAERLGLTLAAAVGGFFLILGLFLIEATVSFFSVRSIEMVNVLTYGGRATCQYPSDLYPRPLRILFTWVAPFALSMHLPISYVLGKPLFHVPTALVWLAPLAGLLFFLMMTRVWYVGVRHYRSTGT